MKQKGVTLTLDSVISIIVGILITMVIYQIQVGWHSTGDAASIEKLYSVSETTLGNMNKVGYLDRLGCCWATNDSSSVCGFNCVDTKSEIKAYMGSSIPRGMGYSLIMGDDVIYQEGTPKAPLIHSSRLVSGFTESKTTKGWVAHAYEIDGTPPLIHVPYGDVSFDSREEAVNDSLKRLSDAGGNVSLARYGVVSGVKSLWGPAVVKLIIWIK